MRRNHLNILLVEDDDNDAKLSMRAFRKLDNVSLDRVMSGEEALELLFDPNKHLPDVILLDLSLPGIQGTDVLLKLKTVERTRTIPVIPLTSSRSFDEVKFLWKNQVSGYLRKPVQNKDFREIAHRTIAWWAINELPSRG